MESVIYAFFVLHCQISPALQLNRNPLQIVLFLVVAVSLFVGDNRLLGIKIVMTTPTGVRPLAFDCTRTFNGMMMSVTLSSVPFVQRPTETMESCNVVSWCVVACITCES